jgi:DNA-binding protein Fis
MDPAPRTGPMTARKKHTPSTSPTPGASTGRIGPKRRHVDPRQRELSLEELVETRLLSYVDAHQGHLPRDLYELIMPQLERPLLRVAMVVAEGNPSAAATMLGIHLNTLRARLRELDLEREWVHRPAKK